jgi:hypothetical protein
MFGLTSDSAAVGSLNRFTQRRKESKGAKKIQFLFAPLRATDL